MQTNSDRVDLEAAPIAPEVFASMLDPRHVSRREVLALARSAVEDAERRGVVWTRWLDTMYRLPYGWTMKQINRHRTAAELVVEQLVRACSGLGTDQRGQLATGLLAFDNQVLTYQVALHGSGLTRGNFEVIIARALSESRLWLEDALTENPHLSGDLAPLLANHLLRLSMPRKRSYAVCASRALVLLARLHAKGAIRMSFVEAVQFATHVVRCCERDHLPPAEHQQVHSMAAALIRDSGVGQGVLHPRPFRTALQLPSSEIRDAIVQVA